jgi:alkylation response protein AidB-like acyl-CoA dehydrogenase
MDFELTDEQREFRGVVREFAAEVVAPRAERYDRDEEFPLDVVRQMGELGLFGLPLPEQYGGSGADAVTFCIAIEELARADASVAITLSAAVGLAGNLLHRFANEELKQRWLPPLCRGETIGAFGLTEPGGGSDATAIRTTARLEAGEWRVDGSKAIITNSGTPISGYCIVACRTEDADDHSISTILLPNGSPGFTVGKSYRKLGWRASDTHELAFDGCRVPEDHLVGERGAGLRQCLTVLDDGRISMAALSVGLAQACLDASVRYANERTAFGRPIGEHQAIAFKLADMRVGIETARLATYRAAWLKDRERPYVAEASIAKLHASEVAMAAARDAVQVHGGYGYIEEFPVARYYRDAKVLEIGEGTSEMQRLVIARDLGLGEPR